MLTQKEIENLNGIVAAGLQRLKETKVFGEVLAAATIVSLAQQVLELNEEASGYAESYHKVNDELIALRENLHE